MVCKRAYLFPVAAGVMLLWSCNPAPKYARPSIQTPQVYKEAPADFKEGAGWKLASPGDDKIRPKWWELYDDPQLSALEEQVQIGNQNVAAAEANFRAARALVISTRNALAPTLSVGPSYTNSRISSTARGSRAVVQGGGTTTATTTGTTAGTSTTTTAVGGNSTSGSFNNFTLPVDASYTIDFWHRIRNTLAVNAYRAQASAADIATALLSTQTELATDYFQVRSLDAQRQLLEETLANYRESLALTNNLYRNGINSEEEVSQAQNQVDIAIARLTDLRVARAQFEHAIATLMGKPASSFSLPDGKFNPNPPPVPVAVPAALLERRPDIASAERQVAAANANIGVVKAAYYPNITLSASFGFQTSQISQWFNWPSRFWSLGPTAAQTILDAGVRRAETQQAEAEYDQTVATYRQAVLTSFQAVEDNLSALRILSQETAEQQTAVRSATRVLDLSLTRFKSGIDSYLAVITAQNTVLVNRQTELDLQLRQMTSSVGLVLALGGGWDTSQLPKVQH